MARNYPSNTALSSREASHMSSSVKDLLREILRPRVLEKEDGAFEIGYEKAKYEIEQSLIRLTGEPI